MDDSVTTSDGAGGRAELATSPRRRFELALRAFGRARWLALLVLAVVVGGVALAHTAFDRAAPTPRLVGDEPLYFSLAQKEARSGTTSLLPGTQRFDHRPMLVSRVYANVLDPGLRKTAALVRIFSLNAVLFAVVLAAVFWQGGLLGLGYAGRFAAVAFLGLFPWFGYYVHSLWPEIAHAAVFVAGLGFVLAHLRRPRWFLLPLAGVCFGYAILLKGTIQNFIPLAAVFLGVQTHRAARERRLAPRLLRAAAAPALLLAGVLAVIGPQLVVNARAGYGLNLAANQWRNIEWGVRDPVPSDPPELQAYTWTRASREYQQRGRIRRGENALLERERRAKQRTLEFVRSLPPTRLVSRQAQKLWGVVTSSESSFESSLTWWKRWGDAPPRWLLAAVTPARVLWLLAWISMLLGAAIAFRRSAGFAFVSLFVAYYLAALFVVPGKERFAIQLVPAMSLFAGFWADALARKLRERWPAISRRASPG